MNPILPDEKILAALPSGSKVFEVESPPEMNVPSYFGVRIPSGQVLFFLRFENHEEWQEFKKNRTLILAFPLGEIPPFGVGAYHVENDPPRLQNSDNPNDYN